MAHKKREGGKKKHAVIFGCVCARICPLADSAIKGVAEMFCHFSAHPYYCLTVVFLSTILLRKGGEKKNKFFTDSAGK